MLILFSFGCRTCLHLQDLMFDSCRVFHVSRLHSHTMHKFSLQSYETGVWFLHQMRERKLRLARGSPRPQHQEVAPLKLEPGSSGLRVQPPALCTHVYSAQGGPCALNTHVNSNTHTHVHTLTELNGGPQTHSPSISVCTRCCLSSWETGLVFCVLSSKTNF